MIVDLHTHTTASDGSLSPVELLERAAALDVSLLAITDHDTMSGYAEAREHAATMEASPRLISGVELSCQWGGSNIHVLGLNVDMEHPALRAGLNLLCDARQARAERIAKRLSKAGCDGALEGAHFIAGSAQIGRPHFAQYMVDTGFVEDVNTAFDRYLGSGKIGDVKLFWPRLEEVVPWICSAGGQASLAHPLKYRFTGAKLRRLVQSFKEAGGLSLEVISGRQSRDQTAALAALCVKFNLAATVGSDYHRDFTYGAPLGSSPALPSVCRPLWSEWE